ncbi:uncharacterized protein LOC106875509 [Octopus bimaculoides]|uniref:uncharacterized protein LOC106875509 n=1 Tax=Octopus bimaculoides TaxID=37653 RepID=UPI00071DD1B2|nr:uncharacterized protein LOC106875509 [Octopus bimaculoides]|eukprot:XP_014779170.1 PREDICTED: uncharacterized protein LOC106875509 [Octopus bimaculoides]
MLLRNLDPPKLCNGTRLIVRQMYPHLLEATILTGQGKGENVFIPKIPLIPADVPFEFKRQQFPLRVSFAMSINKSGGQSLEIIGLYLMQQCFSMVSSMLVVPELEMATTSSYSHQMVKPRMLFILLLCSDP